MGKPVLFICGMAFLLLLFGFGAAAAGGLLLEGKGFSPITIAVADEDGDPQIRQFLTYLTDMEDIGSYIRPVMTAPGSARTMVAEGDAAAALILPRGFLDSVYQGKNLPPLLIMDAARPLEVFGLSLLAENAGSMLANAQKGSYFIQSAYNFINPAEPDYDRMLWEVDMKYAFWVLGRSDMYRSETVSPVGGSLNVAQHYLLSALIFFCYLAPAGLLYPIFSWKRHGAWLRRIRGTGRPLSAYALAQILWGTIAITLLLLVVIGGLSAAGSILTTAGSGPFAGGVGTSLQSQPAARLLATLAPRLSLSLLPGVLLSALFLSAFIFLCCNTGYIFTAVSLDFILAGVFLAISGGLVPPALLPKGVAALGPYCPSVWMRDLLSGLYLPDVALPAAGMKLAAAALLLIAAALLFCRRFEARWGGGL